MDAAGVALHAITSGLGEVNVHYSQIALLCIRSSFDSLWRARQQPSVWSDGHMSNPDAR